MLFEKIKLEENERVITMVRRHWFLLFIRVFSVIIAALFPLFLILAAQLLPYNFVAYLLISLEPYTWELIFLYSIWLLFHVLVLAYVWTDYYLDLWVITDRRLISVEQLALFSREIGSFRLERLQDLNIEITGLIPTLLNYGTIEAQTASASNDEFRAVGLPDPRGLKSIILAASDERMHAMGVER